MEVIEIKRPVLGASNIYVEKILAISSLNSTHSARFYTFMLTINMLNGRIIYFYVIFLIFAKLNLSLLTTQPSLNILIIITFGASKESSNVVSLR